MKNQAYQPLLQELKGIVGADHVLTAPEERHVYGYDASVYRGTDVTAVALPETTEEVAGLVTAAHRAGLPVIARGAGTGINGGALPQGECLVIVLSRMNKVLAVEPENRVAVVQPGVINQDLKTHLNGLGYGFTYVPDPGSQVVSTIGGNVGNNAGGMHCLKYGVTVNHILGLEIVLPDGQIVRTGGKTPGHPGMDLTGLFVGSEGTLGVITEITLRILPLPERVVTQLAVFPSVTAAANTVSGIMAAGMLPAALELLDKKMLQLVDRFVNIGFPPEAGAALLIEMDGLNDGMDAELRRVAEICQANDAVEIETAETEEEAAKLWLSRRAAYPVMARVSPTVYVIDCCVPRNRLAEAMENIVSICQRRGLDVVNLAHAGDGNIHPLIPFDQNNRESREQAIGAHHEVMELCVSMGGSITGEHGVGVEKQDEIELMYTPEEMEAMFAVKLALDAEDRFNPRKIFPLRFFPKAKDGERALSMAELDQVAQP